MFWNFQDSEIFDLQDSEISKPTTRKNKFREFLVFFN